MATAPERHAAVAAADPAPKNSSTTPSPIAHQPQPKMTIPKIDAYFATLACENASSSSARARHVYVTTQLVDQFGAQFGMSGPHAKMAVEEEMNRRYKPNPWDAPGAGRGRRQRGGMGGQREEQGLNEGKDLREELRYSEEEWDRFECSLGYK